MSADSHSQGLARIASKETNQHKQGRGKDAATPKLKERGDSNPTKSGGINRAPQGYKHG
jgi:hypothetical protein